MVVDEEKAISLVKNHKVEAAFILKEDFSRNFLKEMPKEL